MMIKLFTLDRGDAPIFLKHTIIEAVRWDPDLPETYCRVIFSGRDSIVVTNWTAETLAQEINSCCKLEAGFIE